MKPFSKFFYTHKIRGFFPGKFVYENTISGKDWHKEVGSISDNPETIEARKEFYKKRSELAGNITDGLKEKYKDLSLSEQKIGKDYLFGAIERGFKEKGSDNARKETLAVLHLLNESGINVDKSAPAGAVVKITNGKLVINSARKEVEVNLKNLEKTEKVISKDTGTEGEKSAEKNNSVVATAEQRLLLAEKKTLKKYISQFKGKSDVMRYESFISQARSKYDEIYKDLSTADQINLDNAIEDAEEKQALCRQALQKIQNRGISVEWDDDDWIHIDGDEIQLNKNLSWFDETLFTSEDLLGNEAKVQRGDKVRMNLKEAFQILHANKEYLQHGYVAQAKEKKEVLRSGEGLPLEVSVQDYLQNRAAIASARVGVNVADVEDYFDRDENEFKPERYAYVSFLKTMKEDFENDWGDSDEEEELLAFATTAVAKRLRRVKATLGELDPKSKDYKDLKQAYEEDLKEFVILKANVGDENEDETLRDQTEGAEIVSEFAAEALTSMSLTDATEWTVELMARIDSNNYQSSELKTTYAVLANNCKSILKQKIETESGQNPSEDVIAQGIRLAKMFAGEGEDIDSDLIDGEWAANVLEPVVGFEDLKMNYYESLDKANQHPLRDDIDILKSSLANSSKPEAKKILEQYPNVPTDHHEMFAQYTALKLIKAQLDGKIQTQADMQAFQSEMSREITDTEMAFMDRANKKFADFLEDGSHFTGLDIDQYGLGLSGTRAEAFRTLVDIRGYGDGNTSIEFEQGVSKVLKVSAVLGTALVAGILTAGIASPALAALAGGALMTAADAAINQRGFTDFNDAVKTYGSSMAINTVTFGAARYAMAANVATQMGRNGAMAGNWINRTRTLSRLNTKNLSVLEEAAGTGQKLLGVQKNVWAGMGSEMAADFTVGVGVDTAWRSMETGASFMDSLGKSLQNPMNYAFLGLPIGFRLSRGFWSKISKASADNVNSLDTSLRGFNNEKSKFLALFGGKKQRAYASLEPNLGADLKLAYEGQVGKKLDMNEWNDVAESSFSIHSGDFKGRYIAAKGGYSDWFKVLPSTDNNLTPAELNLLASLSSSADIPQSILNKSLDPERTKAYFDAMKSKSEEFQQAVNEASYSGMKIPKRSLVKMRKAKRSFSSFVGSKIDNLRGKKSKKATESEASSSSSDLNSGIKDGESSEKFAENISSKDMPQSWWNYIGKIRVNNRQRRVNTLGISTENINIEKLKDSSFWSNFTRPARYVLNKVVPGLGNYKPNTLQTYRRMLDVEIGKLEKSVNVKLRRNKSQYKDYFEKVEGPLKILKEQREAVDAEIIFRHVDNGELVSAQKYAEKMGLDFKKIYGKKIITEKLPKVMNSLRKQLKNSLSQDSKAANFFDEVSELVYKMKSGEFTGLDKQQQFKFAMEGVAGYKKVFSKYGDKALADEFLKNFKDYVETVENVSRQYKQSDILDKLLRPTYGSEKGTLISMEKMIKSAYENGIDAQMKELSNHGFSKSEIKKIRKQYLKEYFKKDKTLQQIEQMKQDVRDLRNSLDNGNPSSNSGKSPYNDSNTEDVDFEELS